MVKWAEKAVIRLGAKREASAVEMRRETSRERRASDRCTVIRVAAAFDGRLRSSAVVPEDDLPFRRAG